jgi:hypothetical protein
MPWRRTRKNNKPNPHYIDINNIDTTFPKQIRSNAIISLNKVIVNEIYNYRNTHIKIDLAIDILSEQDDMEILSIMERYIYVYYCFITQSENTKREYLGNNYKEILKFYKIILVDIFSKTLEKVNNLFLKNSIQLILTNFLNNVIDEKIDYCRNLNSSDFILNYFDDEIHFFKKRGNTQDSELKIKIAKAIAGFTPTGVDKFVEKLLKNGDTTNIMKTYINNYLCLKSVKHNVTVLTMYKYKLNLKNICTLLMNDETIVYNGRDYNKLKTLLDSIDTKTNKISSNICLDVVEYNDKDFQMDDDIPIDINDDIGDIDLGPQITLRKGFTTYNIFRNYIVKALEEEIENLKKRANEKKKNNIELTPQDWIETEQNFLEYMENQKPFFLKLNKINIMNENILEHYISYKRTIYIVDIFKQCKDNNNPATYEKIKQEWFDMLKEHYKEHIYEAIKTEIEKNEKQKDVVVKRPRRNRNKKS